MWVLVILMFFSLLVALIFLGAFLWAVKSGQYDDKLTPSLRVLLDDENTGSASVKTDQKEKLK